MSKRVYISGQMSGLPRDEYIARFAKAEELLRGEGYDVVNPARLLPCRWPWLYRLMGYRLTILYDLWRLSSCDLIYKIPGWKESHGANIESCWAYHTNIALLYSKTRQRIDLKMAKFIDKADERMCGDGGNDSAGGGEPDGDGPRWNLGMRRTGDGPMDGAHDGRTDQRRNRREQWQLKQGNNGGNLEIVKQ